MKIPRVLFSVICLCLLFGAGRNASTAGEKKISKKQIPAAVLAAFKTNYPAATIKGQAVETEKGKKFYEIESVDGKTNRDLLYTPDGKISEIEEGMDIGTLPAAMKGTVDMAYPGGKLLKAEKVIRGTDVTYELHVKVGKKTKEVALDASGKILETDKKNGEKEDEEKGEEEDD
ncbi:MAG TPA: PepSY-like domain-containing protein [Bacteroidota bacterium]|nr:PepSY-like domain-containing protein [Bacteroidota bacterium]